MVSPEQHQKDLSKEDRNQLVFSYLTLRNLIGFSGMALPWVLVLYPNKPGPDYGFQPSISDYFYTDCGDFLVVLLSVLGVFLLTYQGYNWKERTLTIISAIGALGVAFIPTTAGCNFKDCKANCYLYSAHTDIGGVFRNHIEGLHITSAALFLAGSGFISLLFFKLTSLDTLHVKGKMTQKGKRNRVYSICGWIMLSCVSILAIHFLIGLFVPGYAGRVPVVLIFETIAVEAFGIAWITKGQTLWPDKKHITSN